VSDILDWVLKSISVLSVQEAAMARRRLFFPVNTEPLNTRIAEGVKTMINFDKKLSAFQICLAKVKRPNV
jgi:hypothetical protein